MSVALVVGVGVWGYKLMMRDVTGIPVVRAMQGEMRVRPEDPGGELAQHQGLAVNAVAADGGAEAPADRLVLAPQPVHLTDEDVPLDDDAVAIVQQAVAEQLAEERLDAEDVADDTADRVTEAAQSGSMDDLVAALTDGVEPLDGAAKVIPAVATQSTDIANALVLAMADQPGIQVSLRPQLRPVRLNTAPQPVAAPTGPREIDAAALPAGTRLAQLGAYDTRERARAEWDKFTARFGDLLDAKDRVIEEASSGGRKFYRLRAMGFDDLADARRFCSALVAEGADCIPVVSR
ncbi:SPOR domain-containing protein [Aliishimia ponticola]|uniref:SPOR domain-containing protein n=2 Tax=Aliishimia ponticola TaxID=2499833 RepID=A0A4V3XL27_9RHOB|nr:SPOR domain-containing protein [Aliishimia ponticola]